MIRNLKFTARRFYGMNLNVANKSMRSTQISRNFATDMADSAEPKSSMLRRFIVTTEVTISKLFPAGFGWQAGSIVAAGQGYNPVDLGFFVFTGAGDFAGVLLGHTIFYTLKSFIDSSIKVSQEVQVKFLIDISSDHPSFYFNISSHRPVFSWHLQRFAVGLFGSPWLISFN